LVIATSQKLLEIGQTNSTLDGSEFSIPFRYLPSDKKKGFVNLSVDDFRHLVDKFIP
jgi:hypothetical protein